MNDDVDDIFEIQSSPEQLPDHVQPPVQDAPEVIDLETSPIIVNANR